VSLQRTLEAFVRKLADEATLWRPLFGTTIDRQGRTIIRQFWQAGAITAHSARCYYARSSAEANAFARLLEEFIICQPTPGRYFLNLRALEDSTRFGSID
jgi:hypothetical protein